MEVLSKILGIAPMLIPFFILILVIVGIVVTARWINSNLAVQEDKHHFQKEQKVLINELIETLKKGKRG